MTHTPHTNAIWELLGPYIASDDPPDSGDSEKDLLHLMEGVLPNVWDKVGKLDAITIDLLGCLQGAVEYFEADYAQPPWFNVAVKAIARATRED